MEGISDLKIVGIDPLRPPRIQKAPCIDLVFKLVHKAPKDWCDAFNLLMGKQPYTVRIDPAIGLYVETWVRKPDEIERSLAALKKGIAVCIEQYIAQIAESAKADAARNATAAGGAGVSEEQQHLDRVVAGLRFDA